jgi:hypothetical protein
MSAPVLFVAELLRAELERHVRAVCGPSHGTEGCCTIASLALAQVLHHAGYDAAVAYGLFLSTDRGEPHTWVLVSEDGYDPASDAAFSHILDVTADQFLVADTPVVVYLEPGNPARGLYACQCAGDAAANELRLLYAEDARHARMLALRVQDRLSARLVARDGAP